MRIFVATPFQYHAHHRRAIFRAIQRITKETGVTLVDTSLGDGVPRGDPPVSMSLSLVATADIVICLVGQCPGSFIDGDTDMTFVMLELRQAIRHDAVLIPLLMSGDAEIKWRSVARGPRSAKALDDLYRVLGRYGAREDFETSKDVEIQVRDALNDWGLDAVRRKRLIKERILKHMEGLYLGLNDRDAAFETTIEMDAGQNLKELCATPASTSLHRRAFCGIAGCGNDWIHAKSNFWHSVIDLSSRETMHKLVRAKLRCVGRNSGFELGGLEGFEAIEAFSSV
jgi:hypothetical protein